MGFSFFLLSSCATSRHSGADDLPVYSAVVGKLATSERIAGMHVSAWLHHDGDEGCTREDREFLSAVPLVSPSLIEDYCSRATRSASLTVRQRRELDGAVPKGEILGEQLRDLYFSAVGYDERRETALVFLRRQVAKECDVGEYFILKRGESGWVVAEWLGRWIS